MLAKRAAVAPLAAVLVLAWAVLVPQEAEAQEVTRAVVAMGVEDREPVESGDRFTSDVDRLYFFTEFQGEFPESQFEHVWIHEGEERDRIALSAQGPRWRTWSSKAILPEWTGQWTVRVVDSDGNELASATFQIEG